MDFDNPDNPIITRHQYQFVKAGDHARNPFLVTREGPRDILANCD